MFAPFLLSMALAGDDPCAPFTAIPEEMVCTTPQTRGVTKEDPLQWGPMAFGALWNGLLLCPDGSLASADRSGSVGSIPGQDAPRNPAAPDMSALLGGTPSDIIDRWEITCPGMDTRVWYVNGYRCGDPCPPDGLRVTPGAVLRLFEARDIEPSDARAADALRLADEVTRRWPDLEPTWVAAEGVWRKQSQIPQALGAYKQIERFRPLRTGELAFRSLFALHSGDYPLAREAGVAARQREEDPRMISMLTCVIDAATAFEAGKLPAGLPGSQWCASGIDACCIDEKPPKKAKKKKKR